MRILVTGGTGFIGSNLALHLQAQGHEVVVTGSIHERQLPDFKGKIMYTGLLGIPWETIGTIDAVFHQGAISDTRVYDRDEMLRANVETTKAVFEYAAKSGAHSICYASSTAVYGNLKPPYQESGPVAPLNAYGESKAMADVFAMQFAQENTSIRVVGLRYGNVYGPGEGYKGKTSTMIYQFARQMQNGNPRLFKFGEQKRDYIYVKDVVRANLAALQKGESCVVNCASGKATSFNDIVAILNRALNLNRTPEYIDNPYGEEYQSYTECAISLAKEKLGFIPEYDIESGIKEYLNSGPLLETV